jgi:hypothetical protein
MKHLDDKVAEIFNGDELEQLKTTYRLWRVKRPGSRVNLTQLWKRHNVGIKKYYAVTALLGGADAVHDYLGKLPELDQLNSLLEDAIEEQRKNLNSMSSKERNELIKMLLDFRMPKEKSDVAIHLNMDRFLAEHDKKLIDAEMYDDDQYE